MKNCKTILVIKVTINKTIRVTKYVSNISITNWSTLLGNRLFITNPVNTNAADTTWDINDNLSNLGCDEINSDLLAFLLLSHIINGRVIKDIKLGNVITSKLNDIVSEYEKLISSKNIKLLI